MQCVREQRYVDDWLVTHHPHMSTVRLMSENEYLLCHEQAMSDGARTHILPHLLSPLSDTGHQKEGSLYTLLCHA